MATLRTYLWWFFLYIILPSTLDLRLMFQHYIRSFYFKIDTNTIEWI